MTEPRIRDLPRESALRLGPADEGRLLCAEAFAAATFEPGHRYELMAGRLSVSPAPNLPHELLLSWLHFLPSGYSRARPDVIDLVLKPRLLTRALGGACDVEPDLAAYRGVPRPRRELTWKDISPFLVVEILSERNAAKDLVRNQALYWEVPSIMEYWILDPAPEPPSLLALVRGGGADWEKRRTPPDGVYRTPLLPGLEVDLARADA